GWGRTSTPAPGSNRAGPISSRKTNGPTVRRWAEGKARRTSRPPPRSLVRGTIRVSILDMMISSSEKTPLEMRRPAPAPPRLRYRADQPVGLPAAAVAHGRLGGQGHRVAGGQFHAVGGRLAAGDMHPGATPGRERQFGLFAAIEQTHVQPCILVDAHRPVGPVWRHHLAQPAPLFAFGNALLFVFRRDARNVGL